MVQVPKLGELRKLPVAEMSGDRVKASSGAEAGFTARLIFGLLVFVAIIAGGISAYGAMRWFNLPIPMTSDDHVRMGREEIAKRLPVELITDWQQYETIGLQERTPFPYQRMQNLRDHWLRICLIPLGVAVACIVIGILVVTVGRGQKIGADT
jgi:hypothetical protein